MRAVEEAVVRAASLLVPGGQREEWLAEWRGELWYARGEGKASRLRFCLGAFPDAWWLRRNGEGEAEGAAAGCLMKLGLAAGLTAAAAAAIPGTIEAVGRTPWAAHAVVFGISLIVLPAVTTLDRGEYGGGTRRAVRLWRWGFLLAKMSLAVAAVFFGVLDAAALTGTPVQAHGWMVGYVFAIRWAIEDQRRRCPVCLRELVKPTTIGSASRTLLEWHGTELICARGHGLLHVPDPPSSSFSARRWMFLGESWAGLFGKR